VIELFSVLVELGHGNGTHSEDELLLDGLGELPEKALCQCHGVLGSPVADLITASPFDSFREGVHESLDELTRGAPGKVYIFHLLPRSTLEFLCNLNLVVLFWSGVGEFTALWEFTLV
jgi:hypothetical protein